MFPTVLERTAMKRFVLETAGASLRLILAVHIVLLVIAAPLSPMGIEDTLFLVALMSPPALLLAAPIAPFHRAICGKSVPFVRKGAWWLALYGVVLVAFAGLTGASGAMMVVVILIFPLAACAVIAAYVGLWKLGDAWLGDASAPKVARRWAFSGVLIVLASAWIPYVVYAHISDSCYDLGGAMSEGWRCEY